MTRVLIPSTLGLLILNNNQSIYFIISKSVHSSKRNIQKNLSNFPNNLIVNQKLGKFFISLMICRTFRQALDGLKEETLMMAKVHYDAANQMRLSLEKPLMTFISNQSTLRKHVIFFLMSISMLM
jgi:hypothetical protein